MSSQDEWMADGLCRQVDMDMFFPEQGGSTRDAKRVCLACPVQAECLAYALANPDLLGVWGSYSERERHRLAKGERFAPAMGNQRRQVVTAEQRAQIEAMLDEGTASLNRIAKVVGVRWHTVERIYIERGAAA